MVESCSTHTADRTAETSQLRNRSFILRRRKKRENSLVGLWKSNLPLVSNPAATKKSTYHRFRSRVGKASFQRVKLPIVAAQSQARTTD